MVEKGIQLILLTTKGCRIGDSNGTLALRGRRTLIILGAALVFLLEFEIGTVVLVDLILQPIDLVLTIGDEGIAPVD